MYTFWKRKQQQHIFTECTDQFLILHFISAFLSSIINTSDQLGQEDHGKWISPILLLSHYVQRSEEFQIHLFHLGIDIIPCYSFYEYTDYTGHIS